ncbi:MAG: YifB family Mg chelatase-like AAA ATPase [Patescibacteria group bacterium]
MLSRTFSAITLGLEPIKIEIEVDSNRGQPAFILIGLPGKTVDEAKERISSALRNCGIRIKSKRTVVNLAPADIKKTSPVFELAIAIGILKMYGEIEIDTDDTMFFGELSLDGDLKNIKGALPLVLAAKEMGFKHVILPKANAKEVAIIDDIAIHPINHLSEYLDFAENNSTLPTLKPVDFNSTQEENSKFQTNFSDIHGQDQAKRCLEIAAAGGHNLLMEGPPGAGKSMMAQALISILPPLNKDEAIEVSKIYSICGLINGGLIKQKPFRSPHHTTSQVGLIGGGSNIKPGEISLSHRGVLFLDEFPEFLRSSLEALRQPMEDGVVSISRAMGSATYPSRFTLVAAANPCPCGYHGSRRKTCVCSANLFDRYQKKISGPILDRIDMHLRVEDVEVKKLAQHKSKTRESSQTIRARVIAARKRQEQRYKNTPYISNAELSSKDVKKLLNIKDDAKQILTRAIDKLGLSARSYFKIIKVAQTIADLENSKVILAQHIAEALQYRRVQKDEAR